MNVFFKLGVGINLVLTIVLGVLFFTKTNDIALVRTPEVLARYQGMIEANALLKEKENEYLSRLDTLRVLYNREVNELSVNRDRLSKKEITRRERKVEQRHQDYLQYQGVVDKKYNEDQEKITAGAINQVNDFIRAYAEKHKLKVVIGSNITGNVLYGHPDLDITEDIIQGLNDSY
jgi:outer membrane protein